MVGCYQIEAILSSLETLFETQFSFCDWFIFIAPASKRNAAKGTLPVSNTQSEIGEEEKKEVVVGCCKIDAAFL